MYPCTKCGSNNWELNTSLIKDTGLMYATCNECHNEISWESKRPAKKRKIRQAGDPCRKCNTPVILKESKFKKAKLKKNYYYTVYYHCTNCKTGYFTDKFKVIN